MKYADGADAIAIGPGIGQREETAEFLFEILRGAKQSMVIDADGLNLLAKDLDVLKSRAGSDSSSTILTPHPGEAGRIELQITEAV